jgi:hypothetical protein
MLVALVSKLLRVDRGAAILVSECHGRGRRAGRCVRLVLCGCGLALGVPRVDSAVVRTRAPRSTAK